MCSVNKIYIADPFRNLYPADSEDINHGLR